MHLNAKPYYVRRGDLHKQKVRALFFQVLSIIHFSSIGPGKDNQKTAQSRAPCRHFDRGYQSCGKKERRDNSSPSPNSHTDGRTVSVKSKKRY